MILNTSYRYTRYLAVLLLICWAAAGSRLGVAATFEDAIGTAEEWSAEEWPAGDWIASDRAVLCTALVGLSRAAVRAPFARMQGRVDLYADWVFGWHSSLMTTMDLAGIAIHETGRSRDPADAAAAIEARYGDYIRARFMDLVVRPAITQGAEDEAITQGAEDEKCVDPARQLAIWLNRLDQDLAAERARRLRALVGSQRASLAEALVVRYGQPLLPAGDDWLSRVAPVPDDLPEAQVRLVLLRSLRPLGSRAAGIAVRMSVFEALAGAAVFQSPEVTWLAGFVAASGAAVTMTALVDGAANWVHAWAGRDGLVDDLRAVVDEAEAVAADTLYARVVRDLAVLESPLHCAASQGTDAGADLVGVLEALATPWPPYAPR